MENAVDALKMAGAVLIFVLAVSIIILFFGQVRRTADTILDYKDRETMYIEADYYYEENGTERLVGLETVIPAIFRSYLENYRITFVNIGGPIYKYSYRDESGINKVVEVEYLDLDDVGVNLANDVQKAEFLRGILYHDFENNDQNAFQNKYKITLLGDSIYDRLKNKKITESLGVYNQLDSQNNKIEKRVITYTVK